MNKVFYGYKILKYQSYSTKLDSNYPMSPGNERYKLKESQKEE